MASLLPFDEDPVITAGYGVGHGNSHGGNVGNARNVRNVRNERKASTNGKAPLFLGGLP
jgi:hypothetical protein